MKRRAPSFLPPVALDRESSEPLHRQLYRQLRRGALPGAAPLPSTRALAAQLGVSRNTVLNAYEALAAEGLVIARRGSGTRWNRGRSQHPGQDLSCVRHDSAARRLAIDLLRDSQFPFDPLPLRDPDGNPLYVHR